ncbi:MAG TPA: YdhR family protein [Gammaproteobacteria bacterium]|nr:YdhR family protein [Gammaproteobacteria bacterium]
MSQPAVVLLVRFKSALSLEEITDVVNSRIDQFRALDGLMQKYYLHDKQSGEIAGLYLWDSAESLSDYQQCELRNTIAAAYEAVGAPRIEVYEVLEVLRR